jgi:hypothetical protein
MQNELATISQDERPKAECDNCHKPIELGRVYWKRFCSKRCRYLADQEARKIGRQIQREKAEAEKDDLKNPLIVKDQQ